MDENAIDEVVGRLFHGEPTFDWVGVYVVEGDTLVLGPFRGEPPTGHERIPIPEGVCGAVVGSGETEVVPDVRARPGHIACSLATRSEVVAPVTVDRRVVAVLDVDSDTLGAFHDREVALVETAAAEIAARSFASARPSA
ncbi:MAG TPA: GAF domain-containing protein [Actinomycetota bacterium]|nr:GAF domain-containing protein [Actinomycetota bacterium]